MVGSIPYHILRVVTKVQDTSGDIKTRVRSRSNASERGGVSTPRSATFPRVGTATSEFETYQQTRQRSRTMASQPSRAAVMISDLDALHLSPTDEGPSSARCVRAVESRVLLSPKMPAVVGTTLPIKGRKKSASVGSTVSNASTNASSASGVST